MARFARTPFKQPMIKDLQIAAWFALVAFMGASANASRAQCADRDILAAAAASITKDELRTHVDVLADDTMEGRETGSRGGRAAANYILRSFEQLGAAPAGDSGTYFQSFN